MTTASTEPSQITEPVSTGTSRFGGPTSSRATRVLGLLALAALALLLPLALIWSPPEVDQADAVRLFYIHVPSAIVSLYFAFSITLVGSVLYLWKESRFWDVMAGAAAELGVLFAGIMLVTGMLWGKPTWGVYWQWDPRLTSTSITFVLYLGYLAVRRLDMDPVARSKRAAVLGIISFFNLIIIRYSVQWWNGLHQGRTIDIDTQLDGTMLFSFFWGIVTMTLIFGWLLLHRFRLAWLEEMAGEAALDSALAERRAEGGDATPRLAGEGI